MKDQREEKRGEAPTKRNDDAKECDTISEHDEYQQVRIDSYHGGKETSNCRKSSDESN